MCEINQFNYELLKYITVCVCVKFINLTMTYLS